MSKNMIGTCLVLGLVIGTAGLCIGAFILALQLLSGGSSGSVMPLQ